MANAVGDYLHLLVRYGQGVSPQRLVAQIARRYPDARIAVATARYADAYDTAHRLRRCHLDVEVVTPKVCPAVVPRVIAATYSGLAHESVDYANIDFVIAMDAIEAIGERARFILERAERSRLIGLLGPHARPSPRERAHLLAIFGMRLLTVPNHGRRVLSIDVATMRIVGGPELVPGLSNAEILRQGVWRSPVRNRIIARLARNLAAGDAESVRRDCPAAAERIAGVAAPRVVVLVDGVEQAIAMAKRLPDWPVIAGSSPYVADMPLAEQHLIMQPPNYLHAARRSIVTSAALQLSQLEYADVLIRADGGIDVPAALLRATVSHSRADHRLLIIDFDDRHHPLLWRRSRQRREVYERRLLHPLAASFTVQPPADEFGAG